MGTSVLELTLLVWFGAGAAGVGGALTGLGALAGVWLARLAPTSALAVVFGLFLLYSATQTLRARRETAGLLVPGPTATRLGMNSTYPVEQGRQAYYPQRVWPPGGS